ncbi:MAG: hypothetical protein LBS21_11275 [Clostridiales bacterium]|nr:hypothetical protein [Clostridiales bacterium]
MRYSKKKSTSYFIDLYASHDLPINAAFGGRNDGHGLTSAPILVPPGVAGGKHEKAKK